MTFSLASFRAKFSVDELTVVATEHWTWSVRPVQSTLGCGILSLNRLCPTFGGITAGEGEALAAVVGTLEDRVRDVYAADKFNYLMYMMNDPHVHMHVFPRFKTPRVCEGRTFVDDTWPRPPSQGWDPDDIDLELLAAIKIRLAG